MSKKSGLGEFDVDQLLSTPQDDKNVKDPADDSKGSKADVKNVYDWRIHSPDSYNPIHFLRWLVVGGNKFARQSDEELNENLTKLAQCIVLLRRYLSKFEMPDSGGVRDQTIVLRNLLRALYAGGAPIWALEPVMKRAAEGLTGQKLVNWLLLPRKAFYFSPVTNSVSMFEYERGFGFGKLRQAEAVAARLASFASNTSGVSILPTRFPNAEELRRAGRIESEETFGGFRESRKDMAKQILNLASESHGIFYFLNSLEYEEGEVMSSLDSDFWIVSDAERELFSRLATVEAMNTMARNEANFRPLCSKQVLLIFRFLSTCGSCSIIYSGSWYDMLVSAVIAVCVITTRQSQVLVRQERIVFETVASFTVGVVAGLISAEWPNQTCFSAIALSSTASLMQGFRVVYSVIEVMSRHTVTGTANLLEGMFFTALVAYSLRFGQSVAAQIIGGDAVTVFATCTNGINPLWFILIFPLVSLAWAVLFLPNYEYLPQMWFHSAFAYTLYYVLTAAGVGTYAMIFVTAACVTVSAGLFSRFTGQSAVGNTVVGLYMVVPNAYIVKSLYSTTIDSTFFTDIMARAIVIGLGAWSGTLLCSPTNLGTTTGLSAQQGSHRGSPREALRAPQPQTILLF